MSDEYEKVVLSWDNAKKSTGRHDVPTRVLSSAMSVKANINIHGETEVNFFLGDLKRSKSLCRMGLPAMSIEELDALTNYLKDVIEMAKASLVIQEFTSDDAVPRPITGKDRILSEMQLRDIRKLMMNNYIALDPVMLKAPPGTPFPVDSDMTVWPRPLPQPKTEGDDDGK